MIKVPPVKTPVRSRRSPLLAQNQRVRERHEAMIVDPLLSLAEAQTLLGSPSYHTMRRWLASGALHGWRPHKTGHHKIRLSEIERFRAEGTGEQRTSA